MSFVNLHFAPLKFLFRCGGSLRRSHGTTKDYLYHQNEAANFTISPFFSFFQESITMLPGLQPTTWFAAKSSKFAKFASGTPVGFEDQPVYWTQSSKQNLQQQNISICHLKTRPTQPGIKSKSCSAIHKKWFQ